MFEGGKGTGGGQFDSPTAIAVDGNGGVFIADTGNGRVENFSQEAPFYGPLKSGEMTAHNYRSQVG